VVEGRVARDPDAKWSTAATAELFVGTLDLAATQQVQFDGVEFRQVATNVLIADAAIDDAKITSLTASKITAGTLNAVVVLAGTIQTAAAGARSVISSAGVKLYNAAGDNTVALNASDGSASFSGTIGSVDIIGYARVFNPVTNSQMYMHPGFSGGRFPVLAADTGLLTPTYPGMLKLNAGQLAKDATWLLTTPRVSFANTADPASFFEVTQLDVGLLSNAIMNTTDKTLWPTRIGGYMRVTVPYGSSGSSPVGWSVTTRPYFEFLHDYSDNAPNTPLAAADTGGLPGIHWGNKYGHQVGFRLDAFGTAAVDCAIWARKNASNASAALYAAAFNIGSHSSLKQNIDDVPWSALEVIEENPARRWEYLDDPGTKRVGPMADNLPEELLDPHGKYLDTTSAIGLLWSAVSELVKEVRRGR
jgi:hypothetical protein